MPDIEIEILTHAARRGITRLVHFTRAEFLEEIRDQGLVSTQKLRCRNATMTINDHKRLDRHPDYVCCSVQYPNVNLLEVYSKRYPDSQWIILFLHVALLGLPTTKFSPVNSATGSGTWIDNGSKAFQSLFNSRIGFRERAPSYPENCPTDIQAEVLVKDIIPTWLIIGIAVKSKQVECQVRPVLDKWHSQPCLKIKPILFDEKNFREKILERKY